MKQIALYKRGSSFFNPQDHNLYTVSKIKNLILKGTNVRVLTPQGKKSITKNILAQILFINHETTDKERNGYVKRRSIQSLHEEIRVLSPFEDKYLNHYKNYDLTKKYINPHNITILD